MEVSDGNSNRIAAFNIQVGKNYLWRFDIEANEYNGDFYNNVNVWGVTEIPLPQEQAQQ